MIFGFFEPFKGDYGEYDVKSSHVKVFSQKPPVVWPRLGYNQAGCQLETVLEYLRDSICPVSI